MKSFLPLSFIVLCFWSISCAKVNETPALNKVVKASHSKENEKGSEKGHTENPNPSIKGTKPEVLDSAPVLEAVDSHQVEDVNPLPNLVTASDTVDAQVPAPVQKSPLEKPVASFANNLNGIANEFGVIKAVNDSLNRAGISDIDYPYIIWDTVPGATGYEITRKHDGESDYTEFTTAVPSILSPKDRGDTDENFDALYKAINGKYSYGDYSLNPKSSRIIDRNSPKPMRKYYYKVKAVDGDGQSVESDEIEINLLPQDAKKALEDIFEQNLGYLLYSSEGFRIGSVSTSTYNGAPTGTGTYAKKVTSQGGNRSITYTYNNYSEYKGAIVVNGTLTGALKGSGKEKKTIDIDGTLSITGPYNATINFKDFVVNQRGKAFDTHEEIDDFVSGTISITYQDNNGNDLGQESYKVGSDALSALITTSEDIN